MTICFKSERTICFGDYTYLTISNALGVIYDTYNLTSSQSVDFNILHYPIGSYIVKLFCNGKSADTKVFVKE